ncbi:ribosomal-processing cysteine protease Prp [Clostridium thermarum]|uniref:ribosomal-processing cysteine protease Prp n=1 Tax=Clostridium thermarum TaxID=1716543 RepID=UPI0013D2F214|nr:ribosomal-processing cysteine protease Prp [Clostridium thermarum]
MIDIVFHKHKDDLVSFTVSGHAEYMEGDVTVYDDVICGVVSNLSQVTILGVTEVLKLEVPYVAEEGDIRLDISRLSPEEIKECQILFRTMLLGLENLEMSYSEYIKVSVEEVQ